MQLASKQKISPEKLKFLRDALFSPAGFDFLCLHDLPLSGYHRIERDCTVNDFRRKIKKGKGFVFSKPLLISHYYDFMGQSPVKDEVKAEDAMSDSSVEMQEESVVVEAEVKQENVAPKQKEIDYWETANPPANWPEKYYNELEVLLTALSTSDLEPEVLKSLAEQFFWT